MIVASVPMPVLDQRGSLGDPWGLRREFDIIRPEIYQIWPQFISESYGKLEFRYGEDAGAAICCLVFRYYKNKRCHAFKYNIWVLWKGKTTAILVGEGRERERWKNDEEPGRLAHTLLLPPTAIEKCTHTNPWTASKPYPKQHLRFIPPAPKNTPTPRT